SGQAWMNRPDDYMFIDLTKEDRGAHFLFDVDQDAVVEQAAPVAAKAAPGVKVASGVAMAPETFIEVKRLARMSLDDVKVVVVPGSALPTGINVGTADADAEVVTTAASGHITGKKFDILDIDTSSDASSLTELPKGGFAISELMVPAGKRLVMVMMEVKPGAD